ncbi:MAG: hypothetical protein IJ748_06800 [Bacteroidales bacterium]|nr:hypothetical protein [Bacteroidales bacterium]
MRKFLFFILALFSFTLIVAQQQTENCPFGGRENCTGYCGLFTDGNGDGFCDYALLTGEKKTEKQDTVVKKTSVETSNALTQSQTQKAETKDDKSPNAKTQTSDEVKDSSDVVTELSDELPVTQNATKDNVKEEKETASSDFHFWSLLIVALILYILSVIAVKTNLIQKNVQIKIWNCVWLVTFCISFILGLYIVLANPCSGSLTYNTVKRFYFEFSMFTSVLALIHILWNLSYFKNIMKDAK